MLGVYLFYAFMGGCSLSDTDKIWSNIPKESEEEQTSVFYEPSQMVTHIEDHMILSKLSLSTGSARW